MRQVSMNKEQIIKALEWCIQSETCEYCEYREKQHNKLDVCSVKSDALALINSQEQRIKELTEKNERLKSVEFTCGFVKPHKVLECPIFDEIARTKADTVRKMQERLHKRFKIDRDAIYTGYNIHRYIDQIAKEMLEGEKSQ